MRINKRTARKRLAEGGKVVIRDNKGNHAGTAWPNGKPDLDECIRQATAAGWGVRLTFHAE